MSAIVENPDSYFRQLIPDRDPLLLELEEDAQRNSIPIVGPVVGELLYIFGPGHRSQNHSGTRHRQRVFRYLSGTSL